MKAYYYVYNHANHSPKVRHPSLEAAQNEAERLTLQHNLSFEILKCVGVTRMTGAETVMTDDETEEVSITYYYKDKNGMSVPVNIGF